MASGVGRVNFRPGIALETAHKKGPSGRVSLDLNKRNTLLGADGMEGWR
jgi:hypothetical protein